MEKSVEKHTAKREPQNRRMSNNECRRVESLRSDFLKIKDRTVDSILISNYGDFFLAFFAVLMLVTKIEINSLVS